MKATKENGCMHITTKRNADRQVFSSASVSDSLKQEHPEKYNIN